MMSVSAIRKTVYTLLGALVLTTLWVTSLTLLSTRPAATTLLTDAGAQVLNPFLVAHETGISQSTYATLEQDARAHPSRPLSLSILKVRVQGSEIVGRSYDDGMHIIYGHVAATYYDSGPGAVFALPADVQKILPTYGFFNPGASTQQIVPGVSIPTQLPDFLQPFFAVTGFTPDSLTNASHQHIASLLLWFWVATLVLGALTLLLDRDDKRLSSFAASVTHGAWPVILVLGVAWGFSLLNPTGFAPFRGAFGVVVAAFLPIYGTAFVLGLAGLVVTKIVTARAPQAAKAPATAEAKMLAAHGMPPVAQPSAEAMQAPTQTGEPLGQGSIAETGGAAEQPLP
jgi:hypothetical protein